MISTLEQSQFCISKVKFGEFGRTSRIKKKILVNIRFSNRSKHKLSNKHVHWSIILYMIFIN